jgi:hypothetical protein
MATAVAQAASVLLTQTASAASPTPPPPTLTLTPIPTDTETTTPTSSEPPRRPLVMVFAACYLGGPGAPWQLDSNISKGKGVELLGVGNTPGWYIIRNPYFHRPCWIEAANIKIFPTTDLTTYPVMTPGIPPMGS